MSEEYKKKSNIIAGPILIMIMSLIYAFIKRDQIFIDAAAMFIVSGLISLLINLFLRLLGKNSQWINMWFLAVIIICVIQIILFFFNR